MPEEQRHNHIATRGERRRSRSPAEVEWLCSESTPTHETSCYAHCVQVTWKKEGNVVHKYVITRQQKVHSFSGDRRLQQHGNVCIPSMQSRWVPF